MKIEIDKTGILSLERKGSLKRQFCFHQQNDYCGDWCPLFQEPEVYEFLDTHKVKLTICKISFREDIQNFTDLREVKI